MPGYRCACEPAAVAGSSVRTAPISSPTRLTSIWHLWVARRLAADRTGGRLLPALSLLRLRPLLTLRPAFLRWRRATVWTAAADACAAQAESASVPGPRHDHRCPGRASWTGDHWPQLKLVERGLPERGLPGSATREEPAADTGTSDVRRSRAIDHQQCVLRAERARAGALQLATDQCHDGN